MGCGSPNSIKDTSSETGTHSALGFKITKVLIGGSPLETDFTVLPVIWGVKGPYYYFQ